MSNIDYIKQQFDQLQAEDSNSVLQTIRKKGFDSFARLGIPVKHEEWKYTRISSLFNKEYKLNQPAASISWKEIEGIRLPGHEQASELIFVNGIFSLPLSTIRSNQILVMPLEEAAKSEYKEIISKHLGHSSKYQKDGINALNTAFIKNGVFIHVKKGQVAEQPIYIYNITDSRSGNILSQPRSFVHVAENAQVQIVETYATFGLDESFTNQVMEIIVEKDARAEYYKIQNDSSHTNQVSTTHIRQVAKSYTHTVTISLNGGIVRNNLNLVLDAENCEGHLYGLYLQKGQTHVDNHTVVDNVKPNCFSNELYKGIIDEKATGVFNGKIFVQPQAQKTNAYQSNKNILLSDDASVNTKPQLEIFADDVKCSHGCTVGKLNEEGLFYLQSRGINEKIARSLLLHAFAVDVLEHIRPEPIHDYVDKLISERLEHDIS
ncbi:MAG: Fe-S cluster assembly protein SufD [Chitinophagales bacterium]